MSASDAFFWPSQISFLVMPNLRPFISLRKSISQTFDSLLIEITNKSSRPLLRLYQAINLVTSF